MSPRHRGVLLASTIAILLFSALTALVAAASIRPRWSPAIDGNERVDNHSGSSWRGNPHAAVDGQGRVYVFWDDYRSWPVKSIYWNTRDRTWEGELLYLSGSNVTAGPIAAGSAGDLYVTYRDGDGTPLFRNKGADGIWGAPVEIPEDRLPADIIATAGGTAHLLFAPDADGVLRVLTRAPDGTWAPAETVNTDVNAISDLPARLDLDDNGTLYVAWGHHGSDGRELVYLTRRVLAGVWAEPQLVASAPQGDRVVGVDVAGGDAQAHVLWASCSDAQGCELIYNQCTVSSCSPQEIISSSNVGVSYGVPQGAVDAAGQVYVLFQSFPVENGPRRLYLSRRFGSGLWTDLVELDANEGGDAQINLAGGGGYLSAVWNGWLGANDGHAIWSHTWQEGFLPGQVADLAVGADDIRFGRFFENSGRFLLPVTVTVHNKGTGPVVDGVVRFQHGLPAQPAPTVAERHVDIPTDGVVDVTLQWDVTDVMGRLDLIVSLDPEDAISEMDEQNNQATTHTIADASPQLTAIRSRFKPGKFLRGVALDNTFFVQVDWNGDLSGTGTPGSVTFELDGSRDDVPVGSAAELASWSYDMGGLKNGSNLLRLTATNAEGRVSRVSIVELVAVSAPAWLTGNARVRSEPPDADYDRVAVYRVDATWPDTSVDATFDLATGGLPALAGRFGAVLQPWTLEFEFRSDGRLGAIDGQGVLIGFFGDRALIGGKEASGPAAAPLEVEGTVRLDTGMGQPLVTAPELTPSANYTVALASLSGVLDASGAFQTIRSPFIDPSLPFQAQNSLSLDVDADLQVMQREDGQLGWISQTLGLNAEVEGLLVQRGTAQTHVVGGVGGQPWYQLQLSPGGIYTESYAADLFAWAQERFFVWNKSWAVTYTQGLQNEPVAVAHAGPSIATDDVALATDRPYRTLDGLPLSAYAYPELALAARADNDMTLVHVRQSGIAALNLSGYHWDGTEWIETDLVTHGGNINAQPALAYSGETPILLWTRVITPVSDLNVGPRTVTGQAEIFGALFAGASPHPPSAAFLSSSPTVIGEATQFFNNTVPGVPVEIGYEWDFGDGTPHSVLESPEHLYTDVGLYTVLLTATNTVGQDVATDTVEVVCTPPDDAGLEFSPSAPVVSQTVTFSGTSGVAPAPTYAWSFGDGSPTLVGNPVTHTYEAAGGYTLVMTATNFCGSQVVSDFVSVVTQSLSSNGGAPGSTRGELPVSASWAQVASGPVDVPSPSPVVASVEPASRPLAAASWLTLTRITSNTVMDFLPALQSDRAGSTAVLAMWLRDGAGNYPLFTDETTRTLGVTVMSARWDGFGWTAPAVVLANVNTREAPQFAYRGSDVVLAWSHDRDGNPATITDTELHVAGWISPTGWLPGADFAAPADSAIYDDGGELADLSPRVVYGSDGQATVVWVRHTADGGDQLWYANYAAGIWTGPFATEVQVKGIEDLELVVTPEDNLIAVWRGLSASGPDLWYSVFDRDYRLWSVPQQLTDDRTVESDYDVVANARGQAVVVYAGRDVVTGFQMVGDQLVAYPTLSPEADLRQTNSQAATTRDLTVADLAVSPPNPAPGTTALVSGTLVNAGSLTADPAYLVFRDNGDDISVIYDAGPLTAGASQSFGFTWDVGGAGLARTLSLIADPENVLLESIESNNVMTLTTVLPDLRVGWRATDYNTSTITVTLGISNGGVIAIQEPFEVELRSGSETGVPYAVALLEDGLAAGDAVPVTFVFDDVSAMPGGATTSYAAIDGGEAIVEADETNNLALVDVPRRPDLALGPYDLTGAPTQLLTVHNLGPIAAADLLISIFEDGENPRPLFSGRVDSLSPGSVAQVPLWGAAGQFLLLAFVDPADALIEGDESNNRVEGNIIVWPTVFLPLVHKQYLP